MRPELRWTLAAPILLGLGVLGAEPYARWAAPGYGMLDRFLARGHPWDILSVDVAPSGPHRSSELVLRALVHGAAGDRRLGHVAGRVQVGEVVETPLLFWGALLVWPVASGRRLLLRALVGVPAFIALEALTTGMQLMLPMAQASALLAGRVDPITAWDEWSRFLEAGGQFALCCATAILIIAATRRPPPDGS